MSRRSTKQRRAAQWRRMQRLLNLLLRNLEHVAARGVVIPSLEHEAICREVLASIFGPPQPLVPNPNGYSFKFVDGSGARVHLLEPPPQESALKSAYAPWRARKTLEEVEAKAIERDLEEEERRDRLRRGER